MSAICPGAAALAALHALPKLFGRTERNCISSRSLSRRFSKSFYQYTTLEIRRSILLFPCKSENKSQIYNLIFLKGPESMRIISYLGTFNGLMASLRNTQGNDNAPPPSPAPMALPGPLPPSIVFPLKLARGAV